MKSLRPGLTGRLDYAVPQSRTVPALLPESGEFAAMPPVLATGYLVGLIEWACMRAIASHLEPGQRTVGVHVDVTHEAPTPVGSSLFIVVELVAVSDRRLTFAIRAHDDIALISQGTHQRAVIDLDTFTGRLQQRAPALVDHPSATDTSEALQDESDQAETAFTDLELVFEAAAATPLDDPAWRQLRVAAQRATAALIEAGRLPPHLEASANDPAVVTARVLARAWRHTRSRQDTERTGAGSGPRQERSPPSDRTSERRPPRATPREPSPVRGPGVLGDLGEPTIDPETAARTLGG